MNTISLCLSLLALFLISSIVSGCNDDCSDYDQPFSLTGRFIQFRLIDGDSDEYLIQEEDGSNGLFPGDQVTFYDENEDELLDYFVIENGVISYRISNEVNLQTTSLDYYVQFGDDADLIPFTLEYVVRENDCFDYQILEAGISFDTELHPLSPYSINEIYIQ